MSAKLIYVGLRWIVRANGKPVAAFSAIDQAMQFAEVRSRAVPDVTYSIEDEQTGRVMQERVST